MLAKANAEAEPVCIVIHQIIANCTIELDRSDRACPVQIKKKVFFHDFITAAKITLKNRIIPKSHVMLYLISLKLFVHLGKYNPNTYAFVLP